MSGGDRFICRREGHKPAMTLTDIKASGGITVPFYITTCTRCGKSIQVDLPSPGVSA